MWFADEIIRKRVMSSGVWSRNFKVFRLSIRARVITLTTIILRVLANSALLKYSDYMEKIEF